MENSKISWTNHTFNAWIGCAKVSPGCANCYAEGWAKRSGLVSWGKGHPRRRTSEANWKQPRIWNKIAGCFPMNPRPRVFCSSLADWMDDEVPIQWLADLLRVIHETPNLDWLMLTKRPENFHSRIHKAYMDTACGSKGADQMMFCWDVNGDAPENVWIGTTVEDQARADSRIPALLEIPAKVRFLSCEPLLEPIDIERYLLSDYDKAAHEQQLIEPPGGFAHARIDWVICGGESGPKHRPFHADWARDLRDQCAEWSVPFFMKQMSGLRAAVMPPIPDDLMIREFPTTIHT